MILSSVMERFAPAVQLQRAVITLNLEDFITLHRSGISHNGIIICKTDRDYVGQAQTLHAYLQEEPNKNPLDTFRDRLIRVKKQNHPKSSRQVFVIQEYTR